MNYYRLPEQLGNDLLAYIQTRPYIEVHKLMQQLLSITQIPAELPQQIEGGEDQHVQSTETQHQENTPSPETIQSSSEQK